MKKLLQGMLCIALIVCFSPLVAFGSDESNVSTKTYTIVINPGHSSSSLSGKEPIAPNSSTMKPKSVFGATGKFTKIPENKTTVSVGLLLRDELEKRGYRVIMTKTTVEEALSNSDRAKIGNNNNADLVISIHADSIESSSVKGASMLVPASGSVAQDVYETSKSYGATILNEYTAKTKINNRGLSYRKDITGFNWSTVPTVLIEMGFLSNASDDSYVSSTKNHPAIAAAIADGIDLCIPYDGTFRDVRSHWAKDAIEKFVAGGYIVGYGDSTFRPNQTITRAEFVQVFNGYFRLEKNSGAVFDDTKNHWAKNAIDIAVTNGVCQGVSSTSFAPNSPITRQEAGMMVANYKKIADTNHDKLLTFKDYNAVALWAKDSVEGVLEGGYMSGYPDKTFMPTANITRAESVSMLGRIPQQ